mmetsp:Transcript_707/g.1569  ORF Transcript_707/g.1569 Transcript_707/m.1569 type:complete len:422 (-) Transcript_707:508-1773(-)
MDMGASSAHSHSAVSTGKTILTALYVCMLGICFVVPVFFYLRTQCEDRRNRRLRDLEIAAMARALYESVTMHREETRAARKKYQEERMARILQLFAPVRMILKEENFVPSSKPTNDSGETITIQNSADENDDSGLHHQEEKTSQQSIRLGDGLDLESNLESGTKTNTDGDGLILIPKPGLPARASLYELAVNTNTNPNIVANNSSRSNYKCKSKSNSNGNCKTVPQQQQGNSEMRTVRNECPICLCPYKVGSDIVWSSNPHCDHVYHKICIEEWSMKQQDGPLCPCCRRDFVIDPFDCRPGTADNLEKRGDAGNGATTGIGNTTATSEGNASRAIPAMMPTTSTRTIDISSTSRREDNRRVTMLLRASIANTPPPMTISMARLGDSDDDDESATSNAAAATLALPTGGTGPNNTNTNHGGS